MSQASNASSVSQTQRKMYEAMMDSMSKSTADYTGKLNASTFSQEAKVFTVLFYLFLNYFYLMLILL